MASIKLLEIVFYVLVLYCIFVGLFGDLKQLYEDTEFQKLVALALIPIRICIYLAIIYILIKLIIKLCKSINFNDFYDF